MLSIGRSRILNYRGWSDTIDTESAYPRKPKMIPVGTSPREERDDRNLLELLQQFLRREHRSSGSVRVLVGPSIQCSVHSTPTESAASVYWSDPVGGVGNGAAVSPGRLSPGNFRRHRKARLLRTANVLALTGLATVGCSICGAVLLVAGAVVSGLAVPLICLATVSMFVGLWVVLPLSGKHQSSARALP